MKVTSVLLASLLSLAFVSISAAQDPTTRPAAAAGDDHTNTPEGQAALQAFRDYNDAMMAGDEAKMLELQHAMTDAEKKYGAAMVAGDLAVGKLKNAAAEKYGGASASKAVGRAINDISNDELHAAIVSVGGDTAFIRFKEGSPAAGATPIKMRRAEGKWKFDMTQPQGVQERLTEAAGQLSGRAKAIDEVTAAVKSSSFESIDELVSEIKKKGL
jgi:hypothetical protein